MTNIKQKDCPECKDLPEGEVVAGHDHRQGNVISKTYVEMAEEYISNNNNNQATSQYIIKDESHMAVVDFAKFLDSMPYLFPHMELMAMRKAREIDREVYLAMVDALGVEKSTEIAREIHKRHKHRK